MVVMLDTSGSLDTAASELGCEVEQLLTPLTCRRIQAPGKHFAVDNGAFSQLEIKGFLSLLKRLEPEKHLCRWVAVPDIVGSARRTLEVWSRWKDRINYPLATLIYLGMNALQYSSEEQLNGKCPIMLFTLSKQRRL